MENKKKRLAIISTHPIQYYAPLFQMLAKEVNLKVFYTWGKDAVKKADPGFGSTIEWDIPLLDGYDFTFASNAAKNPGSHHFKGIINPDLIEQIIAFKPDVIFVFGWAYQSHLKVLRYFKGKVPVWFRGDSTLLDTLPGWKGRMKSSARRLFLKWIYSHIDLALYVGNANRAYFEWAGLKPKRLVFAPHAIDNSRFSEKRCNEVASLQSELNLPADAIIFLFAGKFESKKNPMLLLQAFEKSAVPNQYLIVAGNGVLEREIKVFHNYMVKNRQVRLLSFQNQSQMPVLYQLSTVFCLPSSGPGETWGLAVNEAMVSGCAVWVSNKVGCAANLVVENANGRILPADNLDKWSEALTAATNKVELKEQGQKSTEFIVNYSYEIIKNTIMEQLNAI